MRSSNPKFNVADLLIRDKCDAANEQIGVEILHNLLQLPEPRISVLGGSLTKTHAWCAQEAQAFAKLCAQHGASIITGGGSGIMAAAARGALEGNPNRRALGISAHGLENAKNHDKVQHFAQVANLEMRQWLLLNFSQALVYFPGGYGTLFELSQVLALIDINQMAPVPIVLVCKKQWTPLVDWLNSLAHEELLNPAALKNVHITDSANEAFTLMQQLLRNIEAQKK